jgi:hypothetical protein
MGFQASEAVETLTYDFNPYKDAKGTIPEPTSKQVDAFRRAVMAVVENLGLSPEQIKSGKIDFTMIGDLMEKAGVVEGETLDAVADLTGIPHSVLRALPYRVQAAFTGYIVGVFLNPEA